ncbi:O-methyltransferase-domain-containing protein [Cristinia sonorae]|uniref:O-methyltransferase-domain-containing protein n=1 Tax=Cristinia sonorae TaxID=1940300 RepID=A0A8K0UFG1_9AGAR|nr:O-methyltransferase-domain-containing protein [Cristinia sonorae]
MGYNAADAGGYANPQGIRPEDIKQTPHDRLIHLLAQASASIDAASSSSSHDELTKAKRLVEQAKAIIDGYDSYVTEHSTPAAPIVEKMWREGYEHDWGKVFLEGKTGYRLIPEMSAGPYEGVVLQQLAKLANVKTVLEIGMFTGTTTVSLALVPSVEKVVALELEPYLLEHNASHFAEAGVADKIEVRIGKAIETLDELEEEGASFDMVFIDADKPSYIKYLDRILSSPTLLAKRGFIAADNVVYKAAPWSPDPVYKWTNELHSFNQAVRNRPDVEVVMLPIEDGISLIRRKGE